MRLKPKKTVFNERALLYRRYIGLEQSSLVDKIYRYQVGTNSYQYFQFNREEKRFIEIDPSIAVKANIINANAQTVFRYQDKIYQYWYKINTDFRYWNIYSKNNLVVNIDINSINNTPTIAFYTNKPLDSAPTIRIRAKGEGRFLLHSLRICADSNYSYTLSTWYGLKVADADKVIVANDPYVELELATIVSLLPTIPSNSDTMQLQRASISGTQVDFNGTIEIEFPEGVYLINNLQLEFGDIGKYQTNNYYYVGSFDYMVTGNIEQSNTQYLKGNIMPLTSLNIKHYNDSIDIRQDDLVVVNHHLYSVESPSKTHLHFPKDYYVYYATLNSIL